MQVYIYFNLILYVKVILGLKFINAKGKSYILILFIRVFKTLQIFCKVFPCKISFKTNFLRIEEFTLRKIYRYYRIRVQQIRRTGPLEVAIVRVSSFKLRISRLLELVREFRKRSRIFSMSSGRRNIVLSSRILVNTKFNQYIKSVRINDLFIFIKKRGRGSSVFKAGTVCSQRKNVQS